MRAAAQVRATHLPSGAFFLGALLSLATATGCGDDGSPPLGPGDGSTGTTSGDASDTTSGGTGSSTTSTGTTTTGTSSESSSGSTDTTGSSSSSGSTSGSTDTSSTDSSSSSSSDDTTGAAAVDVPFVVQDASALELSARVPAGWVLVTTAAQWASFTDASVPAGVTFPTQWVLFGSRGPQPYPGHALTVDELSWLGDTLTITGDSVDPADDCNTYDFIWPADTLLSFDALDGKVAEIDDQTVATETSCAAGAAASMSCDLDTPCATDLLCAGIIRSTVLANNPGGLCLDSSNRGTFSGPEVAIPTDGATAEVSIEVSGLSTVDMDVTILLEHNHPAPQELVISLRNPDGNEFSVVNLQSTEFHPGGVPIVPTGFSGDESVNGTWTLIVRDSVNNGSNGSVQGWDLEIMSRLD